MKKILYTMIAVGAMGAQAAAQTNDTIDYDELDEVQVSAIRATKTTPVAFTNLSKEELKKVNHGKDLPEILSMMPSVVTTSDAGAGIGYTTMRVRGSDGSRINVTVNGIPINDAESHNVFWVNMPDLASSMKNIQVQRGVGTSTNGAGAFGASVNAMTTDFSNDPYASLSGSYGMFNTHKETIKLGTGLIKDHWTLDARLSNIGTNGFLDRASADLWSYYVQGGWYSGGTSIKLISFGGKERTYHAWNYPMKEETAEFGRSYNSCGYMYTDENGVRHYYEDQTDNYKQMHYQLLFNHQFNGQWAMSAGLHYTKGDGYYQEYIGGAQVMTYKLPVADDVYSDLVRRKAMDNWFAGGVFSVTYKNRRLNATLGGGLNKYDGRNYGRLLSVQSPIGISVDADHDFYNYRGEKWDGNIYGKAEYTFLKGFSGYVDLQYRHIDYRLTGDNEHWDYETNAPQVLDKVNKFNFFNPKVGLNYEFLNGHRVYASWSVGHKEPTRNNYITDITKQPRSERLFDYEFGYSYENSWLHGSANFYYMDYKDQLVLTGALNEIGEALSDNIDKSFRMGVELSVGVKTKFGLSWDYSTTLSRNKAVDFKETIGITDYDNNVYDTGVIYHGNTNLAFSPKCTMVNIFRYNIKGWEASLQTNYVSKQYMNNADQEDCTLAAYTTTNLDLGYTFKKLKWVKSLTIGCTAYNLFNAKFDNNGWASSEVAVSNGEAKRVNYSGYAAQAGINVLGHVNVEF